MTRTAVCAGTLALVHGAPAAAALTDPAATPASASGAAGKSATDPAAVDLERVVVRGQRASLDPQVQSSATFVEARPLDTPASISVVPEQLLLDRGITGLDDVLRNVPGIQVGQGNATGRPAAEDATSRGFSLIGNSTFRDGLRQWSYGNTPLEFYERTEVLKGLTALQAGFINPGGIVNFITKRPQVEAFVRTDALVDQFGGNRAMVDANSGELGHGLAFRVVAAHQDLRNYIRGFRGERWSGLVAAKAELTPTTRLDLDLSQTNQASDYQSPLNYYNGNPTALPRLDPRVFLGQGYSGYPTRTFSSSARLTQLLPQGWKVVVTGQHQTFSRLYERCGQATVNDPDPATGEAGYDVNCEPSHSGNAGSNKNLPYDNAEARLTGSFTVLGVVNDTATGYQYSRQRYTPASGSYFYDDSAGNPNADVLAQNVYNPRTYAVPTVYARTPRTSFNSYFLNIDQGIYFQDRLRFGEHWQLWGGVRYANLRAPVNVREVTRTNPAYDPGSPTLVDASNRVVANDDGAVFGAPQRDAANSFATHTVTPSVSLVYKPGANLTTYASFNNGLEPGGVAPELTNNAGQVFAPIRTRNYETGVKWETGSALLTATAFRVERPVQFTNSGNFYVQAGIQRHQGLEFSASGRVYDNFTVLGGLMLLDAKQHNVGDPALEGQRPAGVAEVVGNLYIEYAVPQVPRLVLSAGDYHLGDQYLFGDGVFRVPGYDRVDVGGRYSFRLYGTGLTARLNVENVANRYYATVAGNGGGAVYIGAPRIFRLGLGATF